MKSRLFLQKTNNFTVKIQIKNNIYEDTEIFPRAFKDRANKNNIYWNIYVFQKENIVNL